MHSHAIMVALFTAACGAAVPVSITTTTGGVSNDPGGLGVAQELREGPTRVVLGDDAAAQIASVQCTHETACGNVGTTGAFTTVDACVSEVRAAQRNVLTGDTCPKGVSPYALDRCLVEMRVEACDAFVSSCTSGWLCR
jgi:hypothetical protein